MSTKATHLYFAAVHDGSHRHDHVGSHRHDHVGVG